MMQRLLTLTTALLAGALSASAFCGFYVAKADAKLFNKTSQVIIARNGNKTTVTMSSDFEGDVKDFAVVVPVPVVLKKSDIKVVEQYLFKKMDDYSGPRLVSYYDQDPCPKPYDMLCVGNSVTLTATGGMTYLFSSVGSVNNVVTIEAQYQVGEYDILILSATESAGLERWLLQNGYKIPEGAQEVLEPYIKSNLKFFVVKANTEEMKKLGTDKLRPIQISYDSPKYMLPIRLGMANAKAAQDMVVYAISKVGRVEVTNYRTVEMPTGQNVPLFVKDKFGEFYRDLYYKTYEKEGKNNVYLEYAWDISSSVTMFCDPCVGNPPVLQDLMNAGVDWVEQYHGGYQGNVYFTRLHVTYDRENFPQDLLFQETPNKQNYQARYVLHYPAASTFDCEKSNAYLVDLQKRRMEELDNMAALAGWDIAEHIDYSSEYNKYIKKKSADGKEKKKQGALFDGVSVTKEEMLIFLLSGFSLTLIIYTLSRRPKAAARQ